jgi:hypothetical protein
VASLLRYQSIADQFSLAAGQYDILVSELAFCLNYLIGVSREELIQTLHDIGKKDTDIRQQVDLIPPWLDIKPDSNPYQCESIKSIR